MLLDHYLCLSFLFLDLKVTITHLDVKSFPHIHCRFDFDFDFFLFLEYMALRMITFYGLQIIQVNEEPPRESSLDLTLT
jgi:hypothetical protein